jgi:hypothetical protein
MSDTEQARESRLRRALDRNGYRLSKTPSRSWLRSYYGPGYQVVECFSNRVVFDCCERGYEATLDEVEEWAEDLASQPEALTE